MPPPLDLSSFDHDTEAEETGPEPLPVANTGRADWWDLDDWGDEE